MSASKLRAAAADNDLKSFSPLGMPKNFRGIADLMNAVRKGMGLKESTTLSESTLSLKLNQVRENNIISGEIYSTSEIKSINKKDEQRI